MQGGALAADAAMMQGGNATQGAGADPPQQPQAPPSEQQAAALRAQRIAEILASYSPTDADHFFASAMQDQASQTAGDMASLRGENAAMRQQLGALVQQLGPTLAQAGQAANVATQAANATASMAQWTQAAAQQGQPQLVMPTAPASHIRPPKPSVFRGAAKEPRISEWLHAAQQFLLSAGMTDTVQGVFHITNYLGDEAAIWWRLYYQRVERGESPAPVNWWQLRELMKTVFTEINRDTIVRERYDRLSQRSTVARYNADFQAVVLELSDVSEASQIHQYVRGLKPTVQLQTRTLKPQSLMQAMTIAHEADMAIYQSSGKPAAGFAKQRGPVAKSNGAVPMQLGAVSLTPDEKARCLRDGLCFTCQKPGHSARECRSGKSAGAKKKGKSGRGRPPSKN